jgi:hypothetical protein
VNDRLDKAKAAVDAARDLGPDDVAYHDLLKIASIQASIVNAEAMVRIADTLRVLADRHELVLAGRG